jgi:hypothetical protein
VDPPRRPRVPLHMSEQSAIDRRMRARRWWTALWWLGGLAALAVAVWALTYAAYHAMPAGG